MMIDEMETEFLHLIQRATPETIFLLSKLFKLMESYPEFNMAFKEATPPGEEIPPLDVIKTLCSIG